MKPEDIGRRIADRAIRYGNEAGDKFVNAIQSGDYASKGEARRALDPVTIGRPTATEDAAWIQRIADGLVKPGATPPLPNAATGPRQRASYWRNLWNALRGRR